MLRPRPATVPVTPLVARSSATPSASGDDVENRALPPRAKVRWTRSLAADELLERVRDLFRARSRSVPAPTPTTAGARFGNPRRGQASRQCGTRLRRRRLQVRRLRIEARGPCPTDGCHHWDRRATGSGDVAAPDLRISWDAATSSAAYPCVRFRRLRSLTAANSFGGSRRSSKRSSPRPTRLRKYCVASMSAVVVNASSGSSGRSALRRSNLRAIRTAGPTSTASCSEVAELRDP